MLLQVNRQKATAETNPDKSFLQYTLYKVRPMYNIHLLPSRSTYIGTMQLGWLHSFAIRRVFFPGNVDLNCIEVQIQLLKVPISMNTSHRS
jgi:hypothetical protein